MAHHHNQCYSGKPSSTSFSRKEKAPSRPELPPRITNSRHNSVTGSRHPPHRLQSRASTITNHLRAPSRDEWAPGPSSPLADSPQAIPSIGSIRRLGKSWKLLASWLRNVAGGVRDMFAEGCLCGGERERSRLRINVARV